MKINVRLPRGGTSHVSVCVCVIVRHLGSANCHAPPRLPFPLQLWPLRVNYLVIIFPHNAQKFSSPLINWISHAQCGKPSLPPIGKHLSINLQNNAVSVCVCESKTGSSLCNVWDLTFCAALFVATAMTNEWWKSKTMLLPINGNCNTMSVSREVNTLRETKRKSWSVVGLNIDKVKAK